MLIMNGWYMGTEIGARNLADAYRYNLLPKIAKKMGCYHADDARLWKDRALVELNIAVLHSFRQAGATIVDHHTASQEFLKFIEQEHERGRCADNSDRMEAVQERGFSQYVGENERKGDF